MVLQETDSVDGTAFSAQPTDSSRRRRMFRYVPVLLPALLVVAAMVLAPYQPLSQTGDVQPGAEMQAATIEGFDQSGVHMVKYQHEDTVTYSFSVRNTGPVGITVTGVPLPDRDERRLLQLVAAGLPAGHWRDGSAMTPFKPFALGAGEEQRIILQGRFDNCEYYTERAIEIVDEQTVEFRVAGVPRTATVPFERDLLVRSPVIKGCPERTLDRSEHRRNDR